jgi:hypothetical protein
MVVNPGGTNPLRSRLCHQEETKFLRRFQDSGNLVVHSVCRDLVDALSQFGVIRSPHVAHAERRRAGVCSLARANPAARYADCVRLVEWPDKTGWQKLDGSQRGQVQPGLIRQDPVLVIPSSGERPWPPCFLGCRKAPGPCHSQSRLARRMVVKRSGMGSKWRLLEKHATLLVMAQIL